MPRSELQHVFSEMIFILRNYKVTIHITIARIVIVNKLSNMNTEQQFKGHEVTKIESLKIITLKTE